MLFSHYFKSSIHSSIPLFDKIPIEIIFLCNPFFSVTDPSIKTRKKFGKLQGNAIILDRIRSNAVRLYR